MYLWQDKAHCPFHLKTGVCRFGQSCSRVHFYPDKSCTLLIKNMYNGPGLAWEQDEGLEVCNCILKKRRNFFIAVYIVGFILNKQYPYFLKEGNLISWLITCCVYVKVQDFILAVLDLFFIFVALL